MRKGLIIVGAIVAASIVAYKKLKKSEEEDFSKVVPKTVKDKVDGAADDIKIMINKKAKKIAEQLTFEKTVVRAADRITDKIIRKVRRQIENKVNDLMFWEKWLD